MNTKPWIKVRLPHIFITSYMFPNLLSHTVLGLDQGAEGHLFNSISPVSRSNLAELPRFEYFSYI